MVVAAAASQIQHYNQPGEVGPAGPTWPAIVPRDEQVI